MPLLAFLDAPAAADEVGPRPTLDSERIPTRVFIRERDGDPLGELRFAVVESVTDTLNGVGEHVVSWSPDTDLEPGAAAMFTSGRLKVWGEDNIELAVYHRGALVAVGPVVRHQWSPGRVTTTCWSREAYLERMVIGPAGRTNLLPDGEFDASLTGWTEQAGADTSASSLTVYGDYAYSLRIESDADAYARSTLTQAPLTRANIENILVVARWSGADGWANGIAARVVHETSLDGVTYTGREIRSFTVPSDLEDGEWTRLEEKFQRFPGYYNRFRIDLMAPESGTAWFGLVRVTQNENVGALAGTDYATMVAAIYDYCLPRLPGGNTVWSRYVTTVGETLSESVRYDFADHRDVIQALRDWEAWGDWWVRVHSTAPMLRYGARRGSTTPVMLLTRDDVVGLTLSMDATDASTEVITLADGQDGPNREEGSARLGGSLVRLMRVEQAQRGLPLKELDDLAAQILAQAGPARVSVDGRPADGPATNASGSWVRGLAADWWHATEPGDAVTVRVIDGELDMVVASRIVERTLNPVTESLSLRLEEVAA